MSEALRDANIDARVDHRSLAAQGIDREPRPRIPLAHLKMEQQGVRSELAARLRADYQERVARRLGQGQEHKPAPPALAAVATDLEEVRRRARQEWLRLRGEPQATPARGAESTLQASDDELSR
jgi:hypothetical protein